MNFLITLLTLVLMFSVGATRLNAQNVNIPDSNFKAYLLGNTIINSNGDSEIQMTEAANHTSNMNCYNLNISDLTGIEAFTNLEVLNCAFNNLTSLDLSQNTALTEVICENNNLTSLILPTTGNLFIIECRFNQITTLDLSQVPTLSLLNAEGSGLYNLDLRNGNNGYFSNTSFNVTNNPNLSCINVDDAAYSTANWTNIDAGASFSTNCTAPPALVNIPDANFKAYLVGNTAINTNGNTEVEVSEAVAFVGTIDCSNLNILELTGVEEFVNLAVLDCSSNNLTSLDLTQNTSLTALDCNLNNLGYLNVKNNNNINFTAFDATNNSGLGCIEVDAVAYSTTNWTNIDAGISFSTNCVPPVVNIPDANFKTNLLNNTAINTNGDGEIQVTEAAAFTGTINCSSTNLINVTGLEAFVNLTGFVCTNNAQLLSLDVSQNVNLLTLNCSNNYQLSSLNANNNLQTLTCTNTDLYGLFVSNITGLVTLNCSNNKISSLNVSQNINLVNLNCSQTDITILDLSNNPNLEVFQCDFNNLSSLDVRNGNNTIITNFQVNFGSLSCVDVDNVAYSTANWTNVDAGTLFSISCNGAPIVNIPDANFKAYLVGNPAINTDGDTEIQVTEASTFSGVINCPNSNITDLTGIEAFVNLTQLKCYNNNLGSLDLSQNTSLIWLHCVNSSLSSLDVSQNTSLTWLYCSNNPINSLDLTENTSLTKLYCTGAQLTTLNIKNGNNTNMATFKVTNNPSLICIGVDDAAYSTANWGDVDAMASFNISCIALAPTVNIPDANFKAYLVGNSAINTDGDSEIQVSEARAFSGAINCSNLNIRDLIGIEVFENLIELNCSSNMIGSLDLTQNSSLTILDCSVNQLNNLNAKNGNNTNVTYFDATNNSNLSCIGVDNGTYSTTNWINIDATTSFSTNCGAPTVNIPDANFKAYLVGNPVINTNGDAEIQVTEATVFNGVINCPSSNIADLTGIEFFVNVRQLKCYNNNISSLDLSQNTSLTWLHCVKNSISNLDLSQNTGLTWLYCSNNPIGNLDLTQNTSLTRLYCSATQLSSLNLKNGNNTAMTIFKVTNNPNLTCIEVDDVAYSTTNWADIDVIASFSTNCTIPMVNGPNANEEIQGSVISTNINSINKAINLSVYPNPTTKEITLDFDKSYEVANIQITNLTGQIVLSKQVENSSRATLELEGPTGIYFVSIQTEAGKATLKVIKE